MEAIRAGQNVTTAYRVGTEKQWTGIEDAPSIKGEIELRPNNRHTFGDVFCSSILLESRKPVVENCDLRVICQRIRPFVHNT